MPPCIGAFGLRCGEVPRTKREDKHRQLRKQVQEGNNTIRKVTAMSQQISLSDLAQAGAGGSTAVNAVTLETSDAVREQVKTQLETVSVEEQQAIDKKAAEIDLLQPGLENSYGKDVSRATSGFADEIMEKTRSKDSGDGGDLLREMLVVLDRNDMGAVAKVPLLGRLLGSANNLRRKYQTVSGQIDEIVGKLERAQSQMIGDIAMYDRMYEQNAQQYRDLRVTVAAGRKALEEFRTGNLPQLERQVSESSDPMAAQQLKDFRDKLERFDKRLDDLDRIGVVCLQQAPEIKLIQQADQTIANKIDTTISTTIPVWKSQMVVALGLQHQKTALDLQNKADDLTNRLLARNAAAIHSGAVAAEKANQRGVVDVETLEKVNNELISALKETVEVQKAGREQREQGRTRMRQIEQSLKQALIENAQAL